MQIVKIELSNNYMSSNCYLLIKDNNAVVIDPGFEDNKLYKYLKENNLEIESIVLTHGHYDHWTGLEKLLKLYPNALLYASSLDDYWYNNNPFTSYKPNINFDLNELDKIKLLGSNFKVIKVPGHSKGSIALLNGDSNIIFVGDVLFFESIGRTDLHGGSFEEIKTSILRLYKLNSKTIVYNGHGRATTIEHEKDNNPFVKNS